MIRPVATTFRRKFQPLDTLSRSSYNRLTLRQRTNVKTPKTTYIATRVDPATRALFLKKVEKEREHDASSILRALIRFYILKGLPDVS
jgi:hypothetical protein